MGAGAGAAAAIDNNELSPRASALEKAQAELRRDLAVREERRRELEFLDKGGEPLDFNFGEALPAQLSSLSPTEPLDDQLLSEGEGDGSHNLVTTEDATTLNEEIVGGGGAPEENKFEKLLFLENEPDRANLISRHNQAELKVDRTCRSNDVIPEVDSERVGGDFVGSKSQMHVKRNRPRSQRLGNGHTAPKEVENLVGADSPVVDMESKIPSVSLENEAMLEVLPRQSSHSLPRKWSGLTSSQEFEAGNELLPRCGPVSDRPAIDASSRDPIPSHLSVQSADAWVDSKVDTDEVERVRDTDVDSSTPHVQKIGELGEADGLASRKNVEGTPIVESAPGNSTRIKEESGTISQTGNEHLRTEKKERVGPSSVDKANDMHRAGLCTDGLCKTVDGVNVLHADTSTDVLGGPILHRNSGLVKKAAVSRGGNHARLAARDRSAQEEKRGGIHHVRIKSEDGVAENRARPSAADAEPGGQQTSGAPSSQEELRAEGQAGAVVGGIPRAIARSSSVSASSNCKYPGVVLPWEKEQDPLLHAEAERHKAELQVKANKARDDYILEEAENLEAKRKFMEKWHFVKKSSEPARRETHWDFVLEEMCWLAKDFFQERRWKIENAARICHNVAYEKNKDEYLALDFVKRQRKRASFLAFAVNKFWRMAEASLTKGKPGSLICDKSGKAEETRNDTNEAVPMDVDVPASREALNKPSQSAKLQNSFGVKRYAVDYLKVIGCGRVAQAVAPITPDQYFECNGIPYFFDQERFSKELLYYTVPAGAMEAYRISVEMERSRAEVEYEEKRATAVAEAEALAAAEASGDASLGTDFGFSDFLVDGGSQEYEFQTNFMGEGGHARISKKKRKKIFKNSNAGRRLEGIGLQGFTFQSSGMSTPDMGLQSPIVTGKRSLPGELGSNSVPGSIPVKRARSSATNLRPRASHSCISPGTAGGYPRTGLDSQDQHEDEGVGMPEGSNRLESANDISSSKTHGVGGIGGSSFTTNKLKKKKKTKAFPGLSNSRPFEGGLPACPPGKNADGDSQDLLRFEQEQIKRKGEPNWPLPVTSSDASLGTPTDTPGTPGSQGLSGQQNVKKQKSLKQNETNSEAATPASVSNLHTTQQLPSAPIANKLLKQSSMRDRNRRVRPNKVPTNTPAGVGIPWSTSEDQAILALVHDLGPNWELVSDVLSSNSQIKGIFRKPKQCKERHTSLTERFSVDGMESQEDPNSLQLQGSKGNVKGPRVHGVPEEDSLKHLECIVQLVLKYRMRKNSSDGQDQKTLAAQHPSHGIAISQFCTGGPPNPLELCDRVTNNGDATSHSFPIQPAQGSVLGPPLIPGSVMRPPSGGLPVLPGTTGFNLGQSPVSSSAAMSAAAARDAQRFTTRLSPEEATRLRMAAGSLSAYNSRRLQQQAVTAGLPILSGLPNPSDLPMLPTSTTGAMLGALSRGLSLPRAGLPSMGSPVVSNMVSPGLSGMVPPAGTFPASNMSRRTANLLNMLRVGACTEEQRLQILQQLQLQAQQGDNQAAAALSNLSSDMAAMSSSPPQSFSPQHQPLQQQQHFQQQQQPQQQAAQHQQQQQVQNQQRNQQQQQQHMQMQANPTNAYYAAAAAAARMKEHQHRQQQQQQQQTLQQHQQKQRLMGTLPPAPQTQHMLVPPHVPSLPPQQLGSQSHILSQQPQHNSMQKQLGPQQGVGLSSQASQPALGPSAPASPAGSGQSNPPVQQNQPPEQLVQTTGSSKPPQGKQTQTPQTMQQPSQRNSTGPSRGASTQDLSSQTGQPSTFANSLSSGSSQPLSETPGQIQPGQKIQQRSGQVQAGNANSGSHPSGSSQYHGSSVHGGASQILPSGVPQSKAPQQSQSQQQQQMPQGGVSKQQQGASIQTAGQAAAPQPASIPTSNQQLQQPLTVPSAQQAQQMQRSQAAQPQQLQQPQRRLQTRHLSATPLGMPMPGLLSKTGMQQTGQAVSSQMSPLPNHNPYQLGGTAAIGNPISLSNPNSHGVPLSSALNSSTMGAHSTQWKSNQANTPLSGGIYNLTRTNNSAGSGQVSGTTSSGLQLPSFNGSAVSSHGMPLGSMPQTLAGVSGTVQQTQKHGMSPGVNGRAPAGAQQAIPSGQRSQQNGSVMVSSAPPGNPQMRPPGPPAAGGLVQGGAAAVVPYARVSAPESSNSVPSPMLANSGQVLSSSGAPISQRPAAASTTASGASGGSTSSGSSTTVPSAAVPGFGLPPQGEATTPASSS